MSKHLSKTKFIIAITIVMLIFSAFMIMPMRRKLPPIPVRMVRMR